MEKNLLTVNNKINGQLYITFGHVTAIAHDKGFYYVACKECKKKVVDEHCEKCRNTSGTKISYMFNMRISDGTGSLWVHVFGEQGDNLIGVPAEEIKRVKDVGDENYKRMFDSTKSYVLLSIM